MLMAIGDEHKLYLRFKFLKNFHLGTDIFIMPMTPRANSIGLTK